MTISDDEKYLNANKTWHVEDSPWKARQILKLINSNNIKVNDCTICEVGCGAGEILVQLSKHLDNNCEFIGFDISPQVRDFWKERENDKIRFICQDFLISNEYYEILMFIDLIEHIEDYIGFLRKIKGRGHYKIFNFPLEIFALKALLGHKYVVSRAKYGHLHYFNKDICLALLKELDFNIIDYFYAPSAIELSNTSSSISRLSKTANLPRVLLSKFSVELTAKLLGGYSLFVLSE